MAGAAAQEDATISNAQALEAFAALPPEQQAAHLTPALRGVLAETATTARVRYEWRLLKPLLHAVLDALLSSYAGETEDEVGPPRPIPGFGSLESLRQRLHSLIDSYTAAPFTYQRLCEVLLEPRKQYSRLEKVGLAVEKLLTVTSCIQPDPYPPPLPTLSSLSPVNDNPFSPYQDGRPPNIVQPQQQQQQLLAQQQLDQDGPTGMPNGTYGPQQAPGARDAFSFFLDAEIVANSGTGLPPTGGPLIGPQPAEQAPAAGAPQLDAAEVARAEAEARTFVEAALMDGAPAPPAGAAAAAGSGRTREGDSSKSTSQGEPTPALPGAKVGSDDCVPPTPEGLAQLPAAPELLPGQAGMSDAALAEAAAPWSESAADMETDQLTSIQSAAAADRDNTPGQQDDARPDRAA